MNDVKQSGSLIELTDRKELRISGVEDIYSFDENTVCLQTALGELNVDGKSLKLCDLSIQSGIVSITGTIDGCYYVDRQEKKKRGLFGNKS